MIEEATAWLFKNRRRSHLFIRWALLAKSVTTHGHDAGAMVPSHLPTFQHDRSGLTGIGKDGKAGRRRVPSRHLGQPPEAMAL